VTVHIRPAQFLKTSGEQGITIGRGTSASRECTTLGGAVSTPGELGSLPGPYGPVEVGANGARLASGYLRVRMITTKGDWKLTVNTQPEAVYYWTEICRAGGIEKSGAEVKFAVDIIPPASTHDDRIGWTCPIGVIASSGDQGRTLGSGWSRDSKDLTVSVAMPVEAGPLTGPIGTFSLDGNGYDDEHVRVRVITYRRVTAFQLTKTTSGVSVYAKIERPHHYQGGAEIKFAVELLGTRAAFLPYRRSAAEADLHGQRG